MRYSLSTKNKARNLRKNGTSLLAISKDLGVSRSVVGYWVSDVDMAKNCLYGKPLDNVSGRERSSRANINLHRLRREKFREKGRVRAGERNIDHLKFFMLYWECPYGTLHIRVNRKDILMHVLGAIDYYKNPPHKFLQCRTRQ